MSEQYDTHQPWIAGYEQLRDELVERNIVPSNSQDDAFELMQAPEAKEAMNRAYNATPEELGLTAVESVRLEEETHQA
jgi:hypothetical protein